MARMKFERRGANGDATRWALASLLPILVLTVLATPASAAPGWLSPQTLAEGSELVRRGPFVTMDAGGEAVDVWEGPGGMNATSRPAAGSWEPPEGLAGSEAVRPCL